MIKIFSLIIFSVMLMSCSHRFILKEPYSPFEINKNYLLIRSLEGNEIKIKGSAKYSIINILKEYKLYPSDSLWCIIQYDEDNNDSSGLPDSLEEIMINKYNQYVIVEDPHYTLFFRNSNIDKRKAISILKENQFSIERKLIHIIPQIFWDINIHINKGKNGVTKIEKDMQ